ncbi:MAG: restriction endonuclease subunit S [Cyanobacteriota bacterium]|nr:restriction endonuclease subunit S [Cyanobacteriota bacterium]
MINQFPDYWDLIPLEDCMEAIIDYRGKTPNKTSFGIPLITAKIIKNGRIEPAEEYINPDDYDDWMRRGLPQPGDIVMTTEAPLGEIAQLDKRKVALAQRLITLRGKQHLLDNNYLKFLLQSSFVQDQLNARSTGTTVLGIKQSELRKVLLVIPPLPEQKAIASILGSLDDKIELNRQTNKTLEAMAQAIFKSWFVDFDPVRAKAEGRDPVGMDAETAALFPSEFVDSELGRIPKGWRQLPLNEVMEINPYRPLGKGVEAPYLDMQNMPTQGHRPSGWIYRPFGSGMKFQNGDTLVARITPCLENGKTAFVDFLDYGQVGWGSTEYIVIRPKSPFPLEYGYLLARDEDFRAFMIQNMTGTSGRQRVPASSLSQYFVAVPDNHISHAFRKIIRPILKTIKSNSEQTLILTETRDILLPKILSGQLTELLSGVAYG